MRDMAGSGDESEARMEVKGMGERREGDGGSLRNPRKKGGRGSERMMVRGNRCRTGIKHKRGDRSLEEEGELATRGRDESGCSRGRCWSSSSRGAAAIELASPTRWGCLSCPSVPRSQAQMNPTPARTQAGIGPMSAVDRNSSISAGRREASRGMPFDPRKSAPR